MNNNLAYSNQMIIFLLSSVAIAWFTSQTFKAILNCAIAKTFTFKYFFKCFFADGDFPSSHTCFSVTSLIIMLPFAEEIIKSAESSIAMISICRLIEFLWFLFVFVIVKDAISVRGSLKNLSAIVKMFLSKPEDFLNDVNTELQSFWSEISDGININVGHMPHEVIGGLILAVIIGNGANAIRFNNGIYFAIVIIFAALYFISTFYILTHKRKTLQLLNKILKRKKKSKK